MDLICVFVLLMKIAITGGIGSGKSFVCRELAKRGIEVYDCDAAAKRLMRSDEQLQAALKLLVGNEVYADGVLQKPVLAQFLLASETNKLAVNDVVHPAVARDFEQSGKNWLESAILFDSGFVHRTRFDYVVCVTAPQEVRLQRIMQRDQISRQKAEEWINAQLPQADVVLQSDFEIRNDGKEDLNLQIDRLLNQVK